MEETDDNFKLIDSSTSLIESNFSEDEGKIINPETNEIEGKEDHSDFDNHYYPITYRKSDVKEEMIICVEMINNNKIYIDYKDSWTIKDLINKIVNSNEFNQIYNNNIAFLLDSEYLDGLFDLNLAVYRNIKSEIETKLDYSIELGYLRSKGLLSNPKFPFLIFNDCRYRGVINQSSEVLEKIIQNYEKKNELNLNSFYQSYLPRSNSTHFLGRSPAFSDYFIKNKRAINKVSRITFDELIPDQDSQNWYIYNDESISYLLSNEKSETIPIDSNIIIISNSQIYLQDKQFCIELPMKDYKVILLSVKVNNEYTTKIAINLMSTIIEILKKINEKLKTFQPKFCFDVNSYVLKVVNYNDYIWEMEEPIGKYTYVIECIKSDIIPEYILTQRPQNKPSVPKRFSSSSKQMPEIFKISTAADEKKSNIQHITNMAFHPLSNTTKNKRAPHVPTNFIIKEKEKITAKPSVEKEETKNDRKEKLFNIAKHIPKSFLDLMESKITQKGILRPPENYHKNVNEIEKLDSKLDRIIVENMKSLLDKLKEKSSIKVTNDMEDIDYEKMSKRSRSKGVRSKKINLNPEKRTSILCPNQLGISKEENYINSIIKEEYSNINIANINRPFSINLKGLRMNKRLSSSYDDKDDLVVFQISVRLLCGMQKFSKPYIITWKGKARTPNIIINRTISFGITYSSLPMILSILFKIKQIKYDKKGDVSEKKTIYWRNFRLFDHLKRLQTGNS